MHIIAMVKHILISLNILNYSFVKQVKIFSIIPKVSHHLHINLRWPTNI